LKILFVFRPTLAKKHGRGCPLPLTRFHDALSAADYLFTYFKGDEILPLTN
jgi:hypothetical protein